MRPFRVCGRSGIRLAGFRNSGKLRCVMWTMEGPHSGEIRDRSQMVTHADRLIPSGIDSRKSDRQAISPLARAILILLSMAIVAAFLVARRLEPDPSGFGTHRQLGLADCPTRERTGRACPTCGMTTAIAHLSDGELTQAWTTQPAGVCIALAAAGTGLWSAASAWRGRTIGFESGDAALAWWAGGSFAIAAASLTVRWQQWAEAAGR